MWSASRLAVRSLRDEGVVKNTAVFGEHEPNTLAQLEDVASRAERAALMADGHLGYVMPIGGVAAYREQVSVVGVGFDIACGNAAIRTDLTRAGSPDLLNRLGEIADAIQDEISFGIGRKNRADDAPIDHPLFESTAWDAIPNHARNELRNKARKQLGTVGSGNHYVDVFVDEADAIWVGVHFGSRGLGHTIASGFLAMSQGEQWGARVPEREALLSLDKPMGQDYWALMTLAGEYAYAGREWVARKVVSLLGGTELAGPQPSQLRLEGDPRRRRASGGAEGRDPGVPRPARVHRGLDGRRCRDRAWHRVAGSRGAGHASGGALLHRPRCRPRDEPDRRGGEAEPQDGEADLGRKGEPRDDAGMGRSEGCAAPRRRAG